jgi:type II secretory pathway pseudopilin PulG
MVELLIVIGIITILSALLIPAVTKVRNTAKETQQKAQLTTIEMALTAFKNDYSDYPPSHGNDYSSSPPVADYYYTGAQTLAEALVGWDLLGFHPKSAWRQDGRDKNGGTNESYLVLTSGTPAEKDANLRERRGPYLERATANVFRLGNSPGADDGLFRTIPGTLYKGYVICDVFGVRRLTIGSKPVKAGTPILYYKANTASKTFDPNAADLPSTHEGLIYNAYDNFYLMGLQSVTADGSFGTPHPLGAARKNLFKADYGEDGIYGIRDSKMTTTTLPNGWPHRPDSYILISAGVDGLYGTSDDIRNF